MQPVLQHDPVDAGAGVLVDLGEHLVGVPVNVSGPR